MIRKINYVWLGGVNFRLMSSHVLKAGGNIYQVGRLCSGMKVISM